MIKVTNNGTTWSFRPLNREGEAFIDLLPVEGWQFLGPTLVLDWRVARDLVEQASDVVEFV